MGTGLYLMHDTRTDMPRLTAANGLASSPTLQHRQIAFNAISSVEAWMRVKACIHLRRKLDKHYHRFIVAVWNVEFF
jgi:hypothetical protein